MADHEQEVFEISDFTSVTEWERFIARIEEIIAEWKLSNGQSSSGKSCDLSQLAEEREFIKFAKFKFSLSHFYPANEPLNEGQLSKAQSAVLRDIENVDNDFPACNHSIAYWYGLGHFLILAPSEGEEAILTEDRAKLLLSSLAIALNNTNCFVAAFVQLWERGNRLFLGVSQESGVRTKFEGVYLYRTPHQLQHLSGLVDIFKHKLMDNGGNVEIGPFLVTARYKYVLRDWSLDSWPQSPLDVDDLGENVQPKDFGVLTLGALEDPVIDLKLFACWPNMNSEIIVDNEVYSDLSPLDANVWSASVGFALNPACSLADCLSEFSSLSQGVDAHERLIGGVIELSSDSPDKMSRALDRLTSAAPVLPTLGEVVAHAHRAGKRAVRRRHNRRLGGGGSPGLQNPTLSLKILQFIFPDALTPTPDDENKTLSDAFEFDDFTHNEALIESLKNVKSAPRDSLTWRLALALAKVNLAFGGLEALAKLWNHFLQEIIYRWEINSLLPSLEPGAPDLSCSLLHQKFQMLNYCIERRKFRESCSASAPSDESEDEEFFECDEETINQSEKNLPDGRLRKLGDLKLLKTSSPIYIPVTQEPAPLTEDGLAEQAEALVRLGTDKDGAALRARMQSACLMSDMEAFKAANPESTLEDFVRWYSPRDWVDEEGSGHLSGRMLVPGNLWKEAWDGARAIPARRQKRLFDETKEAERVIHFLENLTPAQVVSHLMPVLVHAAVLQLDKASHKNVAVVKSLLEQAVKLASSGREDTEAINLLYRAELIIAQVQSLKTKLANQDDVQPALVHFIHQLVERPLVPIAGAAKGIVGKTIAGLFKEVEEQYNQSNNSFPKPSEREVIIRTKTKRYLPSDTIEYLPQKMYAMIGTGEFRLNCAFSSETTFKLC